MLVLLHVLQASRLISRARLRLERLAISSITKRIMMTMSTMMKKSTTMRMASMMRLRLIQKSLQRKSNDK